MVNGLGTPHVARMESGRSANQHLACHNDWLAVVVHLILAEHLVFAEAGYLVADAWASVSGALAEAHP
jgi:hypothetical protein